MKLIRIITDEVTGEGLYAVRFLEETVDEFERLFDLWIHDSSYRYHFFQDHIQDLKSGYYRGISIEQAVRATRNEAKSLRKTLLALALEGFSDQNIALQTISQPLSNNEYHLFPLQKSKARCKREKRWLRIYAIRLDANCFVITGGPIKLTLSMDRPHLHEEIQKLERTRRFRIRHGLREKTDFEYLEI